MPSDPKRVTRALLSVSDKSGLVEFARALADRGVALVSTGGTRKALAASGLAVQDVSDTTGFPEMMDGRVKTLHPAVHGGLLAVRASPEHQAALLAHGIAPIDLLVVNLYPFEATLAAGRPYDECVETIDIGGPAMIRAAAKNHADVAVVVEPADYDAVLADLAAHDGAVTLTLRRRLAQKAYARTAAYDAAISNWLAGEIGEATPAFRALGGALAEPMRYGENPHQAAAFYRTPEPRAGVATARQVQGKQLSYNNINDTDAAYECVAEFDPARAPAVVIVKHANPCGVAEGDSLSDAYERALRCDPVSAFGGIVALNRTLDAEAAAQDRRDFYRGDHRAGRDRRGDRHHRRQEEPPASFGRRPARPARARPEPAHRGGRLPRAGPRQRRRRRHGSHGGDAARALEPGAGRPRLRLPGRQARQVERHRLCARRCDRRHRRRPDEPRRFRAHRRLEGGRGGREAGLPESLAKGSVVASDAFFPFADGLLTAAEAGATAVIQPGGSVRDDEVIKAADEAGLAMVFTGHRHFRH